MAVRRRTARLDYTRATTAAATDDADRTNQMCRPRAHIGVTWARIALGAVIVSDPMPSPSSIIGEAMSHPSAHANMNTFRRQIQTTRTPDAIPLRSLMPNDRRTGVQRKHLGSNLPYRHSSPPMSLVARRLCILTDPIHGLPCSVGPTTGVLKECQPLDRGAREMKMEVTRH